VHTDKKIRKAQREGALIKKIRKAQREGAQIKKLERHRERVH
jgi:hypothetical protein